MDNLSSTFSPELADLTLYIIDVSAGDKIPRKGGPGMTHSDLLIINKTDLAPLGGADLGAMDRDAKRMRGASMRVVVRPVDIEMCARSQAATLPPWQPVGRVICNLRRSGGDCDPDQEIGPNDRDEGR